MALEPLFSAHLHRPARPVLSGCRLATWVGAAVRVITGEAEVSAITTGAAWGLEGTCGGVAAATATGAGAGVC